MSASEFAGACLVIALIALLIYAKIIRFTPAPHRTNKHSLFSASGRQAILEQPLRELDFVVFDTEATGLYPSRGDEMLQLGGVRINGNQVTLDDRFDELVRPGQPIPPASTLIHGITDRMVEHALPASAVVEQFSDFCGESVLVAHCADFDMAVLYRNNDVAFHQPVLDTMLLAFTLEPTHFDLSLDTLAEKYGIHIEGRHTAIGDAIATAELFLALLPVLETIKIRTLGEALTACSTAASRPEFKTDH